MKTIPTFCSPVLCQWCCHLALLLCALLTGCKTGFMPLTVVPEAPPQKFYLSTEQCDRNLYHWPEQRIDLPQKMAAVPVDEYDCGACNTNPPPPWLPAPQQWTVSWTVPAASRTNHPAEFTGPCVRLNLRDVRELVTFPVNYYEPRDTRTNALRQTYQTWRPITKDLVFSAVVTTTNQYGEIGAYTR